MRYRLTLAAVIIFAFSKMIFAQAPTTQATNVTFSNVQSTQFDLTWTNGNGASRAVFVFLGGAGTAAPVNNATYTANLVFGSGTQIGATGWFCVYNGTGAAPTITVTGLTAGLTYSAMVVEYNGAAGAEQYNVSASTGNPNNVVTTGSAPVTQATNVLFSSVLATSTTISWTNGSGSARAVFVLAGAVGSAAPINRTTYTANTVFGSGTQIGATGWFCVYNGTGTTVSITGLTAGITYRVMVTEYNGSAGAEGYNTTTAAGNPNNILSTFTAPSTQATNVAFTTDTNTSVTLNWVNGNGSNRAVFMYLGNAGSASPVDRTTYTANTVFGSGTQIGASGWYCIYNGTGTTVTVTGLTAATFYRVMVCEYNGTSGAEGYNTTTATNNPSNRILAPTLSSVSPPTQGNYAVGISIIPTLTWLSSAGATTYDLDVSTDPAFGSFVQQVVGGSSLTYNFTVANQLTNGVTYYWRVRAHSASSTSAWAPYWSFITVTPAVPYLTNPANGSTLIGNTIYFSWYVTGLSATNFVLEISSTTDFSAPIQTFAGLTSTYYSWVYTGLTPGSTYYWRVTSKTSGGVIVNYSGTWSFVAPGMPTVYPSYPIGGVTVYSTTPSVYYYTGTYYNGQFEVRYATNSSVDVNGMLNNISATSLVLTSNLYATLPTLTAGATYYWQVRSSNGINTSAWSSVQSFVVYSSTPATPVVPYLSWPIGGATDYANPPSFYWYLGTYSTGLEFYLEYANNPGMSPVAGNSGWITNLYYTLPSSLTSGTWYWHAKSRLAAPPNTESTWSTTESFVIPASVSTVPTPTPTSPIGGITIYVLNPTLSYYDYSASALEYQVNYSAWPGTDVNGVLNVAITTSAWTASTSYALTGLTPGVTYYWQVRARLAATPASVSSWSTVATFTTAAGAFAVVPLIGSPNNGQSINNSSAVLSWIIPTQSSSPLSYNVQYSSKPDMSNAMAINNVKQPFQQINGLDPNTTYYWRVSSANSSGTSDYSAIGKFNTNNKLTDVKTEQVIPTAYELSQNYPNPFNPSTNITYALPQNSFVTIKIYDMLGREVKTLINDEMTSGVHSVDWKGDNQAGNLVASATYLYRITAGNFVATKKMVLLK